jgi:hypothetical protein
MRVDMLVSRHRHLFCGPLPTERTDNLLPPQPWRRHVGSFAELAKLQDFGDVSP